ncbi:MAG: PhoH family protein [Waddliaceae bacterium]
MTKKTFVIDTNVLLHDPDSITKFPGNHVVIPMTVLEELDRMKRLPHELGKNARRVFQLLDALAKEGEGDFRKGVQLENGAILRIQLKSKTGFKGDLSPTVSDNRIIMTALFLQEKGEKIVFVSKDFAARIKSEAIGLEAQDYENLKYSYDALYRGVRYVDVAKQQVDTFLKDGGVEISDGEWRPNEYCKMASPENSSAIGKYDSALNRIVPLIKVSDVWGIKPLNVEQRCAMDALLRDDIKLVTLVGPAGTGKTLLALACGLRKVFDEGNYVRILVSRPVVPLGRDIGYLPGTKEEKLFHWMQPIYDNLEFLCESTDGEATNETMNWVMDSNKLEMEAVTYIRGRSLPKAFIIVDEAQNLTPHEMKTIISRAGEGAKVVLTGDPTQIDNPYLDKDSNGLTYTVGRFRDQKIYGHIFLGKTERSELAALAANIL